MTDTTLEEEGASAQPDSVPPADDQIDPLHEAKPEPPKDMRGQIMARAAENARKSSLGPVPELPEGEGEKAEEQPDAAPEKPAESKVKDAAPRPEAKPEPRLKIKVNGVEREITPAEAMEAAQRWYGGDDKFRQAQALLRQQQAEQQKAAPAPEKAKEEAKPEEDPRAAKVKAWANRIAYGNEEEVAAALREMDADRAPASPALSSEDVRNAARAEALALMEHNESTVAYQDVATDETYRPIVEDSMKLHNASMFANREVATDLINAGLYTAEQLQGARVDEWWSRHAEARRMGYRLRPYRALYRAAADATMAHYGLNKPAEPAKPAPGTVLNERRERKATGPTQPRSASATATTTVAAPKTTADTIADMKRMRGQPG